MTRNANRILLLLAALTFPQSRSAMGQVCIDAPPGLVGWWPGDGDAADFVSGNDGVLVNGATFSPGLVEQAFSFDQIDDYVSLGDPAELQITGDLTIAMWIKFTGVRGPRGTHILSRRAPNCGLESYQISLGRVNGSLEFQPGTVGVTSTLIVPENEWAFIAIVYHSDTLTVDFYVNDQVDAGFPTDPLGDPQNADIQLGQANGCGAEDLFGGLMDEVQIFARALTSTEILAEYAAGEAGKCKNDCNENGILDSIETANGLASDCNGNDVPDECELDDNDCNANGNPDECDIADGTSDDANEDGIPDECQPCELVQRLVVTCVDDPRKVRAVIRSLASAGIEYRLVVDGVFYTDKTTANNGVATANWIRPMPGVHEICIDECGICETVECSEFDVP